LSAIENIGNVLSKVHEADAKAAKSLEEAAHYIKSAGAAKTGGAVFGEVNLAWDYSRMRSSATSSNWEGAVSSGTDVAVDLASGALSEFGGIGLNVGCNAAGCGEKNWQSLGPCCAIRSGFSAFVIWHYGTQSRGHSRCVSSS